MNAQSTSARHWSTSDVEPRHALDYWVETVSRSMLELEIDSPQRDHFQAALDQSDFGAASLYMVEANSQKLHRSRAAISRTREPFIFLLQLRQGRLHLRQYGREADVGTDECVLIDAMEPYVLCFPEHTRCLSLGFPRDWLCSWIPEPRRYTSLSFGSANGWGAVLSSALSNLEASTCNQLALSGSRMCEQVAALLALATGSQGAGSSCRRTLFDRLLDATRDRSHESNLTPTTLANDFGITRRYLHHLFAQHGSTFGHTVIEFRLERARQLLSDRRFGSISIGEIAARVGFNEPSHFARRFRQKFGRPPAQFRNATSLEDQ